VVLRLLVLKHLRDWRFDDGELPDARPLIRLAHLIGPETLQPLLERVVQLARECGVTRRQQMRVDSHGRRDRHPLSDPTARAWPMPCGC
jgi:hypothetical protein